jgi:hypothetical protein
MLPVLPGEHAGEVQAEQGRGHGDGLLFGDGDRVATEPRTRPLVLTERVGWAVGRLGGEARRHH